MISILLGFLAWLLPLLGLTQPVLLKRWLGEAWFSLIIFVQYDSLHFGDLV